MIVSDFIRAAAKRVDELFPNRPVYADRIPAGAEGGFAVRCIGQSHGKKLSRRRVRTYQLEILYFQRERDSLAFYDWAETLYTGFEELPVEERRVHPTGAHAEDTGDMVWHFVFDVTLTYLLPPPAWELMEILQQETEVTQNEE